MTDAPGISDAVVEAAWDEFWGGKRGGKEAMRAAIQAAVLAEREECARVADELSGGASVSKYATSREASGAHLMALTVAAAIRARSTGGEP